MAKTKIRKNRCKGCGLCIAYCPKKNIKADTQHNEAGYFPAVLVCDDDCTGCGICYLVCPEVCIEIDP